MGPAESSKRFVEITSELKIDHYEVPQTTSKPESGSGNILLFALGAIVLVGGTHLIYNHYNRLKIEEA